MIFAVFDVLLAVNMFINYSFFYIYICSFITAETSFTHIQKWQRRSQNLKSRSRDREHAF